MRSTRFITGFILGISLLGLAATYYGPGLGRFWGDSNLTTLTTGTVYFNTSSNTFWAGGSSSNPVMVGNASWSNSLTAVQPTDSRSLSFGNVVTVSNLLLSAVRWTDSPMVFSWPSGGGAAPVLTALEAPFGGIKGLAFADGEFINGMAQMPHTIASSNGVLFTELHDHVFPTTSPAAGANMIRIRHIYAVAPIGGSLYGSITNTVDTFLTTNSITHHYIDAAHVDFTNCYPGISGIYLSTTERQAAPSNAYPERIIITQDVHFPVDRMGSGAEAAP